MANQFLALSLFLMLLSFFIVMNSVSGYESRKSVPVLNSLSIAFSTDPMKENQAPSEEETPRMSLTGGDTLENIKGLFGAHISGFKEARNRLGTLMHVRVPVLAFEQNIDIPYLKKNEASQTNASDASGAFLPTLITLLRSEKAGLPYRMDMVLNIPESAPQYQIDNPEGFQKSLQKISDFAHKMEQNGLPAHLVTAGLQAGEPGYLDLYFRLYEPYSPLPDAPQNKTREGG